MRGMYYQAVKCCATCIHCKEEEGDYFCELDNCELCSGELVDVFCQHWKLRKEIADEYEITDSGTKRKRL